ncbi:type II restriction endonuclease [Williamsoniiplasma luminosum]|uniref:Type-2 restriction enzyme n=1 Tax=Williamsoniiplasma luminosum TaxID=214888 RepID=A0A2S0NKX5_9MOLU|nr:type II restriction endonuclease [Williamsoniiplasma luminosum]AVP49666.1 MAG: restriction endonuclease [Williamsoniiplasma luminosum]
MKRDFNQWFAGFRASIADYKYYIDFKKVYENIKQYETELNLLNNLVKSKDIETDFEILIRKYPNVMKVVPTLIAKREKQIPAIDKQGQFNYDFENMNQVIGQYKYFMRETGIFDLLENNIVHDIRDLMMGIEIGLNSNARKNRGGTLMEKLVEDFLVKAGFVKNVNYFKEIYLSEIEAKTGLDLSTLSNNGKVKKRFDFAIILDGQVFAIECNFYSSDGSKLNETARSYKAIAIEANKIKNFHFVWLTDGRGWQKAKFNLQETFDVMEHIYNIKDLEENILQKITNFKK